MTTENSDDVEDQDGKHSGSTTDNDESSTEKLDDEQSKDTEAKSDPEANADEPTTNIEHEKPAKTGSEKHLNFKGFFRWYWSWKKWAIPITVLLIIGVLYLVPFTRYKILGLFVKEQFSVTVVDSTTNTPINGAVLSIDGSTTTTNVKGNAHLKLPVGNRALTLTKQYYKSESRHIFVSLSSGVDNLHISLVATGRQVPIKVVDLITNQPVAGAEIKVLDTEAKTNSSGTAVIVVPASSTTDSATIISTGYNSKNVTMQVTGSVVGANTFQITPAGKIYFLSKLTGTINVDETNLDGTDRQTVLAGTGNESDTGTVLLASRDWKYLALLAQRSATGNPELDLINTSNNQMSNIDEGNATFTAVGWDGDDFIYEASRTNIPVYQPDQEALKSFNAVTGKITILDQSTASGTDASDYISQTINNPYILSNEIVYTRDWSSSYNLPYEQQLSGQAATLNSIQPDGTNKTVIKSFSPASGVQVGNLTLNITYPAVDTLNIDFYNGSSDTYYEYLNGQITADASLNDNNFYSQVYPTYLLSPSGTKTFWAVSRDGANTLLVGDANGNNPTQLATLSPYNSYGWYSDSYLLVSENSSELYIMPVTGGTPVKVTDYHKPTVNFYGYGGGYGGQ